MPIARHDDVDINYETTGDAEDPALLLVNGLGNQLTQWDDDLVDAFVDRGFFVVRFDHRDVGLSTYSPDRIDVMAALTAAMSGEPFEAPYLLADMARDAVAVLDAVGIERAHLFGVSMGGMVAQTIALDHLHRVASLTSVMSTTGDPDVGQSEAAIVPYLLQRGPEERAAAVEHSVGLYRALNAGPEHFEEARVRRRAEVAFDRAFFPRGVGNQLVAILASGSRTDRLRSLTVPTLVIHGDRDPLIAVSGGHRTAEVVPGAELLVLEGMGHDLPTYFWPTIIENVTALAARSSAAS